MSEGDKLQEKEIEDRVIALLQRSSKLYGDITRISKGNIEDTDNQIIQAIFNCHLGIMHQYAALGKITIGK